MADLITIMGTEGRGVAMKERTRRRVVRTARVCVRMDEPCWPLQANPCLIFSCLCCRFAFNFNTGLQQCSKRAQYSTTDLSSVTYNP